MRIALRKKKNGFTLIEVIAVLTLLGIVAAIAIPKYVGIQDVANDRAVDAGIAELNAREMFTWAKEKVSSAGWQSDSITHGLVDRAIGPHYAFPEGASVTGGRLVFQERTGVPLTRTASTTSASGSWTRE